MYLDDNYLMYTLARHLIDEDGFEPLHINQQNEEIWLERYKDKKSQVVRLFHGGFDWKNHLKQDIGQVFQKIYAMKSYLKSKHIEIHNIYITTHPPVDTWQILKRPMQTKEKKPIQMRIYYLSDEEENSELAKLREILGVSYQKSSINDPVNDKETTINEVRHLLVNETKKRNKEKQSVFSYGKPFLTYILLAINILVFLLLELKGNSESTETLIDFGAKYNPAIIENGEWWRLITSMFLHIGFSHLLMNMLAVYFLGTLVERIYGSIRFAFIYFLSGIGGGLTSFAFTTSVSAGASGALFGLFGALLFFGCIYRRLFFQTIGFNVLILVGINIVFGLGAEEIDNSAHIGGLITGFLASGILHLPRKRHKIIQSLSLIVYILIIVGLLSYGIASNKDNPMYQVMLAEQLSTEGQYQEAINVTSRELEATKTMNDKPESHMLFQRAYASIQINDIHGAINDLEKSIELNKTFTGAYYNLAILYREQGNKQKARKTIEKAHQLNPNDENVEDLYEQLTNE